MVHPFFEDEGSAFIAVLDGHAGMAVAQEGVKLFPQKLKVRKQTRLYGCIGGLAGRN